MKTKIIIVNSLIAILSIIGNILIIYNIPGPYNIHIVSIIVHTIGILILIPFIVQIPTMKVTFLLQPLIFGVIGFIFLGIGVYLSDNKSISENLSLPISCILLLITLILNVSITQKIKSLSIS